jgi:hypothetical protein
MEVSESTLAYFAKITDRVVEYHNAIQYAKEYVIRHTSLEPDKTVDCILMSILWVASQRGDELTEDDVCIFLNVDADIEPGSISVSVVPEMQTWSLDEVLEYINDIHGTK